MALSAVLVATLLETVVAQPAAAAPEPKPQTQVSVRADEASARVTARIANRPIEVADLRTETSQTFANPDGTMTLTQSARPVRVRGTDGSWMPVDTTLRFDKDGSVIPAATSVGLRFSGGSGPLATIGRGEQATSLSWPDKLPKPVLLGNAATYADVLPGVDLTLRADVDGFTEVLVVKNRAAAADPRLAKLRFVLQQKALTTKSDEHGNLQSVGADGKPVFVGASPSMWDSSAAVAGDDRSVTARSKGPGTGKHVPMRTRVAGDSLEVTPDTAMLANPGTEFPVFLDPGFTSARVAWTLIFNGNPNQSYWNNPDVAKVGSPNNGTYVMRSFFLMGTNGLQRKQIISATLNTQQLTATSCTPTPVDLWATGGVGPATTWNNPPLMARKIQTVNAAKGFSSACPAGPVSFNVQEDLQKAVNGNASVYYLGLKAPNEGTTAQWKTFANNPAMSVTYNSVPTQPHHYTINPCYAVCGVHPAPMRDTRPTFTARSIDPDAGQKLRLDFEIFQNGNVVQRGSTPWGSSGQLLSWRPATALPPGVTYSAHVRAFDGVVGGPWSAAPSFFVDLTKPGNATAASAEYPAGQWSKEALAMTLRALYWARCWRRHNGVHIHHTAHATTWGRRLISFWAYTSFSCR